MSWLSNRVEKIEAVVGRARSVDQIPDALLTLSPEDQDLVRDYRAARDAGTYESGGLLDTLQTHRAQHRYLFACAERTRALRAAGVPMLPVAETLRRCRHRHVSLIPAHNSVEAAENRI